MVMGMEHTESFVDYLKRLRSLLRVYKKETGKTTADISLDTGIAYQTILKLERGYGMTIMRTAQAIDEYLHRNRE